MQGSATNYQAINFAHREFGVRRAMLPRVADAGWVENGKTPGRDRVFGFRQPVRDERGRCWLSSANTCGESPNTVGACSPASIEMGQAAGADGPASTASSSTVLLTTAGRVSDPGQGRFDGAGRNLYALEEPTSLNVLEILPEIVRSDVKAIKVENRQRSRPTSRRSRAARRAGWPAEVSALRQADTAGQIVQGSRKAIRRRSVPPQPAVEVRG